ncbi:calcium-translocating P-type ATPase, SERCA-type [Sediminibacillus dalangtanensis]|uniref:Calcium-translocating P-type ATPase, SERCA-type n=1 Tax=Sediminibacillus dalangtanensis TaxID=2729421 RepID=A0ABX7VR02_9BACI|nr:calcium-translocating P-type ATPase, SERCA-type [Sediminibacillus dalangtanensis]QTM99362.1 calcium-translocating P-type ATPase, SERCA-type [Sediminibacillus dalangtanensis]
MKWYQLKTEETAQKLGVNLEKGLTNQEAENRRRKMGANVLEDEKQTSLLLVFLKQFQDFMVLVLLAATLVSGLLGEYIDAIAIMIIVLINGFIGFFQEQRAEKSLAKLKELSAPLAHVKRDGEWVKIPSKDVVVGDLIKIASGDRVPADVRLTKASSLELEESALTGESLPVAKTVTPLGQGQLEPQDQHNMLFMGTLASRGSGEGIVVGTGMNTAMGQIASLLVKTEKMTTPLEKKLAELGKLLIVIALLLTLFVVLIGVYQGHPLYQMFLAGVSLAVAAIPEGLPAIVTVALSLGVQRMIKRKAIVRKLSAVETLGSASVICSDKTGTMTKNQMTVKEIFTPGNWYHVTGEGYDTNGAFYEDNREVLPDQLRSLLLYGTLCNHASLIQKKGKWGVDGDPTEGAILVAARKAGITEETVASFKIIKEIPFDSDRKRMTVLVEDDKGNRFSITKGAPDVLLARTAFIVDGQRRAMKSADQVKIEQAVAEMAGKALRTIAIGVKSVPSGQTPDDFSLEKDLTLLGVTGMIDPPRKEVRGAIAECQQAGIKTVMITGDHALTARAIAHDLRLLPANGQVLEGSQLSNMTEEQLSDVIEDVYVFARVTPEHKLKIVKAFQKKGHVVAMTGDGVNDAPAIKASDIGISMGNSGTDVAKEASSLVLLDDNFATIKSAIKEGRNIYENIRKFIRYLLASNVGEILVMLFAMLLALPLPLVPVQILWVNLVTDGLPAMALGLDQPEQDVMRRKPRSPKEGIFSRGLGFKIITRGLLIGLVTLVAFMTAYQDNPDNLRYAQTMAFATLVMAQLIHVFDCRSERSVFSRNPFQNIYLVGAVASSMLLLLVVLYFDPLQEVFHTMDLSLRDWLLIMALSAIPTVMFGFSKK